MKRVVVSGANGFIGRNLVNELLCHDIEVIALVRRECLRENSSSKLLKRYEYIPGSISDVKEKLEGENADTFYHLAWQGVSGNERANTDIQLQNVKMAIDSLRLAKEIGCKCFIYVGSIMEKEAFYAGLKSENRLGMGYVYGGSKLAAHILCKAMAVSLNIDFMCAMVTNTYGVGERSERMVNDTIRKCIRMENPTFTAATQNYDFIYIDDVVRALRLIGQRGKAFGEYVIGSSNAKTLKELLLEMRESIAPELEFIFGAISYTGVNLPLEEFDCSLTERDTGFRAEITFSEGCKRTRDWWLENENNN